MLLLLAMLAVAFLLRIQQWANFAVPDENTNVETILSLHENPFPASWQPYPGYPPFFFYLNFVFSWIYQKLLLFLGVISFRAEFVHSGQELTLKMGRLLSAVWGTGLVYMVFRIGRDFFNRRTAWAAALLTAVNPFMVLNSHIFKPDVLLSLLMMTSLFFSLSYLDNRKKSGLFWSSFFLGLAIVTKYNSAVEVLMLAALLLVVRKDEGKKRIFLRVLASGLAGLAAGIAVGAPNWIVHPVSGIRDAVSFVFYYFDKTTFYDPGAPSYLRYTADFIRSFGWPFFVVFLLGVVFSLVKRKKSDLLIITYMAVYYLILGRSNFYSNRFALPLLGAMAIIIAKTLFLDMDALSTGFPRLRQAVAMTGFLAVLGFSLFSVNGNLKTFNLLSTAGQWERAEKYRQQHIPDRYRVASEAFTPHRFTDFGSWDLTRLPLDRFRGDKAVDFAVTGLLSDYILRSTRNQEVKNELRERLIDYRPFYRSSKTRFGPWDSDVLFWYRTPREFRKISSLPADLPFPRNYLPPSSAGTVFLPLQTFEKNPFIGKTANGLCSRTLYSTRRIEKIKFIFLFPEGPTDLVLTLNGSRRTIHSVGNFKIVPFEITGFEERKMHFDHVYLLEIIESAKGIPCYFIFTPEYENTAAAPSPPLTFSWTAAEEIPELFSSVPTPLWVSFFFRRTGLDLSLLTFINRTELFRNDSGSTSDVQSDWFPLENGSYAILLTLEPLIPDRPPGNGARLKWRILSANGKESEETWPLQPPENGHHLILKIKREEPLAFIQITVAGLRANNILLGGMTIQPDYREWFMHGAVFPGR